MSHTSLPLPKGFSREVQADRMFIRRSWRANGNIWVFSVAAVIWNFISLYCAWQVVLEGKLLSADGVFPLLFLALGFFLIYVALSGWFNTTEMEIGPDILRVTTEPLPWHTEKRIPTAKIISVIFRERAQQGYATTYHVMAVLDSTEERSLVGQLMNYEETVFYVREIRRWLKLPDGTLSPDA